VAAALGYTPSAVSQQLAVLEREAGVPLLERSGRSATLTDVAVVDDWSPRPRERPELIRVELLRDPLLLTLPAGSAGPEGKVVLCAPADQPSRGVTEEQLEPGPRWEFEGLTVIAALVAQGIGVAVLPRLALQDVDPAKLVTRRLRPSRHRRIDALLRLRTPATGAVLAAFTSAGTRFSVEASQSTRPVQRRRPRPPQ
jgi:DNA-binding transcriptional LysR family regulator